MKKLFNICLMLLGAVCLYSCSSEIEEAEEYGYLSLELNTLVSAHTRAVTHLPGEYDARTLHVELRDASGNIALQTDEYREDNVPDAFKGNIRLTPGTYTIEAHSAGWDGTDAGGENAAYYAGSTTATVVKNTVKSAPVTCTLANVKVTVNYDKSFIDYFTNVKTLASSTIPGVKELSFNMPEDNPTATYVSGGTAYFPVGGLNFRLTVTSKASSQNYWKDFSINASEVHARDYFKVNFKVADSGTQDGITVYKDESTTTYTYDVYFNREPGISMSAAVKASDIWAKFATVTGKVESKVDGFEASKVALQYKKASDLEWTSVAHDNLTAIAEDNYTYTIKGLDAGTRYVFRYIHDVEGSDNYAKSSEVSFTTEEATPLYNGGFENWYKDGAIWFPNESGTKFWDSSNSGSAALGEDYNVTTKSTDVRSGASGSCAKLESMNVLGMKFAAASLYTGECTYVNTSLANAYADLTWGSPFVSRPTILRGWMKYEPKKIDCGTQPSVATEQKGDYDVCQIYCALTTSTLEVSNNKNNFNIPSTTFWTSDPRVIAYGTLPAEKCVSTNGNWVSFEIPIVYNTLTAKPSYLVLVCSSSRYGDYFYGGAGSTLYLDDFEFVYGDTPTVAN